MASYRLLRRLVDSPEVAKEISAHQDVAVLSLAESTALSHWLRTFLINSFKLFPVLMQSFRSVFGCHVTVLTFLHSTGLSMYSVRLSAMYKITLSSTPNLQSPWGRLVQHPIQKAAFHNLRTWKMNLAEKKKLEVSGSVFNGLQMSYFKCQHDKVCEEISMTFSDCKGNKKLHYEVSSPHFKVTSDGTLVALKNITAVGRTLFVHARTPHAEDMAELVIVGGKDIQGSLQDIFKFARTSPVPRQKRSIVVSPILIPENQRQPFPRDVGKVVDSDRPEGSKFRLTGKGVDQEPKGIFRINENTGSVSVTRTLDRETIATYQLFVETTDVSGKTLEGPVPLEVIVIDQNDNRPIFREGPYIGHVMEGSPTGTTVMRMTAFDADDPATDNALLRYNIRQQTPDKPSPNMFYIDPEKGDIVTVVSPALLDRETLENPKYELIIEAQDMAGLDVGLTGTATATIVIDDKNDHSPKFTKKEFQATVEEGAVGVIVNLTVEDKDDPTTGAWRAAYTIINGNPGQSFEIHTNPQTNEGMLSVVKPLDYEISAFHTLLIKVENEDPLVPDVSYGPSSTATVHITVLDVNEGPVFYPDPMMVTKWENISVGSVLLTVNATDPDSLQHQTIRYSVYKDPAGWLNINPINGTVDTTAVLDRESPFVHNSVYTALFLAIDS
ncbi:cadherin-13 isoform X1, partial [Sigmodon hispidus]